MELKAKYDLLLAEYTKLRAQNKLFLGNSDSLGAMVAKIGTQYRHFLGPDAMPKRTDVELGTFILKNIFNVACVDIRDSLKKPIDKFYLDIITELVGLCHSAFFKIQMEDVE